MRSASRVAVSALIGAAILMAAMVACDSKDNAEVLESPSDAATLSDQCSSLEACCPSLPSEVATSCKQLALESGGEECGVELAALANAGRCVGDAGASPSANSTRDASVRTDASVESEAASADAGSAIACILLQACCTSGSLPSGEVTTCGSIQGAGDETQCAALLTDLTASDKCSGTGGYLGGGGACPDLSQCCASALLPTNFVVSCEETASADIPATCASTLSSLMSAGFCGGFVATADGGRPASPNCATLATCCDEITFPASALSTCQHIAAANVDGECLSVFDGYVALNYCVAGS